VHITGITFSNFGIAARINFAPRTHQRIRWEQSKRLLSGSVVALSKLGDNFSMQCLVVSVIARPLAGLESNPPEISILFSEAIEIDPLQQWTMIEAPASYFEAYKHSLVALQKQSTER
jgi:helicase required for RNAi-mediated heterochromatin assembly 1